jgi:hypothetical protein
VEVRAEIVTLEAQTYREDQDSDFPEHKELVNKDFLEEEDLEIRVLLLVAEVEQVVRHKEQEHLQPQEG